VRRTRALVKIALAMMNEPHGQHYGYDLTKQAEVLSGTLYPILRRMLADGWLTDGWEDSSVAVDRPPRRYYELTNRGRAELGAVLSAAHRERRFHDLRPTLDGLGGVQLGCSR
jgi:PadR family transcriptional regulator PadR